MRTLGRMGNNDDVARGKRTGSRRSSGLPRRRLALHALAGTATVVVWGYLVWIAVDFGASARGGDTLAWLFLALATLGAIACLFAGLLLGASLLRILHVTTPEPAEDDARPTGGRRRAD